MSIARRLKFTGSLLAVLLLCSCGPSKYVTHVVPISKMIVKPANTGKKQNLNEIRDAIGLEKNWVVGVDYSNIRFMQFPQLKSLLTQEKNEVMSLNLSGNFSSSVSDTFALYYPIYKDFIRLLSAPLNNVRVLDLSDNALNSRAVFDLAQQLSSKHNKVAELDLRNNLIGNRGVDALIQALNSPYCKLIFIDLSYNTFDMPARERLERMVKTLKRYGRDVAINY